MGQGGGDTSKLRLAKLQYMINYVQSFNTIEAKL